MSILDKISGRFKKAAGDLADDPSLRRFGGTPAGNNAARKDAWPKVIAFLRTSLA